MNSVSAIVPLNDSELISLATKARLEGVTGWKRIKLMCQAKIRSLDLSEVEVIEAISEYLIRRPIAEAEKIEGSVSGDISTTEKLLRQLEQIHLKIDPNPSDEMVDSIVNSIMYEARYTIRDAREKKKSQTVADEENRKKRLRTTKEIIREKSILPEDVCHDGMVSLDNTLSRYERNGSYDSIKYDLEKAAVKNVYNGNKHYIDWSADDEEIREVLIKSVKSYIIEVNKSLAGVSAADQHPIVAELYAKHLDEIVATKQGLHALLVNLKEQKGKAQAIIAPIQAMAEDLRMYLEVADDIGAIRKATAFLGIAEQRNAERGHAIAMLAHYSEVAYSALEEVKTTLDSYQSAQRELGTPTIIASLDARKEVYANVDA